MKVISVIIPIYNVEEYLEQCLESVVNQTIGLEKIDVILVNDGSTDSSLSICKKYKKKYNDWNLINKKNEGLSSARNDGIDCAKGEYITFLDSDDYLYNKALENMYAAAVKYKSDLVVCKMKGFDSKGQYGYYSDKFINNLNTFDFDRNKIIINAISVCSKLYKKKIFKNIRFLKELKHEDNYFSLCVYYYCNKITTLPEYAYYRRYREGANHSIMQNLSLETFNDLLTNYKEYFKKTMNNDCYVIKFTIKSLINYFIKSLNSASKREAKKKIIKYIKFLCNNNNFKRYEYIFFVIYVYAYIIKRKTLLIIKGVIK